MRPAVFFAVFHVQPVGLSRRLEFLVMTVEEICERMTLEDAKNILVPLGTCKGWTLGQVLDRRATSLRWYMVGCPDASNVLKAGATLLWNARQMQKAG